VNYSIIPIIKKSFFPGGTFVLFYHILLFKLCYLDHNITLFNYSVIKSILPPGGKFCFVENSCSNIQVSIQDPRIIWGCSKISYSIPIKTYFSPGGSFRLSKIPHSKIYNPRSCWNVQKFNYKSTFSPGGSLLFPIKKDFHFKFFRCQFNSIDVKPSISVRKTNSWSSYSVSFSI